mgnify:CR=1 FL=1
MKANDLAWRCDISMAEYEYLTTQKNKIELVIGFRNGRFERIYALIRQNVTKNEEVGITYGVGFWFDEDALPPCAPPVAMQ